MSLVKSNILVYARLIAHYGNFRICTLPNGSEIKIPAVYDMTVFGFPPVSIELPPMTFEYFNDNIDDILSLMEYNDQYQEMKRFLSNIDTSKIQMPETIPVSEVPIDYVSFRNNQANRNIITPEGIHEVTRDKYDIRGIDMDEDDDSDGETYIENVLQFVSPNFIFQTVNWRTTIDIGSFHFMDQDNERIDEEPRKHTISINELLKKFRDAISSKQDTPKA